MHDHLINFGCDQAREAGFIIVYQGLKEEIEEKINHSWDPKWMNRLYLFILSNIVLGIQIRGRNQWMTF